MHAYIVVDGNNYNSEHLKLKQKWRIKGKFYQ